MPGSGMAPRGNPVFTEPFSARTSARACWANVFAGHMKADSPQRGPTQTWLPSGPPPLEKSLACITFLAHLGVQLSHHGLFSLSPTPELLHIFFHPSYPIDVINFWEVKSGKDEEVGILFRPDLHKPGG